MSTLFEKAADLEKGDTFDVLGESLVVGHTDLSAASKTLYVWGEHEDRTQRPRYEVVVDARYEDVEFLSTDRTDSHVD